VLVVQKDCAARHFHQSFALVGLFVSCLFDPMKRKAAVKEKLEKRRVSQRRNHVAGDLGKAAAAADALQQFTNLKSSRVRDDEAEESEAHAQMVAQMNALHDGTNHHPQPHLQLASLQNYSGWTVENARENQNEFARIAHILVSERDDAGQMTPTHHCLLQGFIHTAKLCRKVELHREADEALLKAIALAETLAKAAKLLVSD
jgi:hypothetical protein